MGKRKLDLDAAQDQVLRETILTAMRQAKGVRADAAELLGRSPAWLYAQLSRLNLAREVRRIEREAGRRTWAPGRPAA